MRTIGLLGGMSWESTREYYRIMNEQVRAAKGGLHSAPVIIHSFDFAPINDRQRSESWDELDNILSTAAKGLEQAGAEAVMICTNYMHKTAPAVEKAISIPVLHIADAVGEAITANGQKKVGLLGARGTMQEPFYKDRLANHDIDVVIPNADDCETVHEIIFGELCKGIFSDDARKTYLEIIAKLKADGAEGIILGCTEIEQLILPQHTDLTLYPSAQLHAEAGVRFMLGQTGAKKAA